MGYPVKAGVVQVSRREVTRLWSGVGCWGAEGSLCSCTSRVGLDGPLRAFPALTFCNLVELPQNTLTRCRKALAFLFLQSLGC